MRHGPPNHMVMVTILFDQSINIFVTSTFSTYLHIFFMFVSYSFAYPSKTTYLFLFCLVFWPIWSKSIIILVDLMSLAWSNLHFEQQWRFMPRWAVQVDLYWSFQCLDTASQAVAHSYFYISSIFSFNTQVCCIFLAAIFVLFSYIVRKCCHLLGQSDENA